MRQFCFYVINAYLTIYLNFFLKHVSLLWLKFMVQINPTWHELNDFRLAWDLIPSHFLFTPFQLIPRLVPHHAEHSLSVGISALAISSVRDDLPHCLRNFLSPFIQVILPYRKAHLCATYLNKWLHHQALLSIYLFFSFITCT